MRCTIYSDKTIHIYSNGAAGCAINLGSSVITTGGGSTDTRRVTEYDEAGWVSDLPDLLQERIYHGCAYYNNDAGTKVKIKL